MKRKFQHSYSSLQEEPPLKRRKLNKVFKNPAYDVNRCSRISNGFEMILETTRRILSRDSTQALLGVLLLMLAVHRANLGEATAPTNPASLNNFTVEDVIKYNEILESKEIWSTIFRGADNMSAIASITASIMSCASLIWKSQQVRQISILGMMALVSVTMIATLVSDVASWMVGYRFKMLSTPCCIILVSLLYALNTMRRALGLDPGVVVAFNDSDDDDKKDPEDHSRCKSCLAMAKEQDGKMQDVKLEK